LKKKIKTDQKQHDLKWYICWQNISSNTHHSGHLLIPHTPSGHRYLWWGNTEWWCCTTHWSINCCYV